MDYWLCLIIVIPFYTLITPQYINYRSILKCIVGVNSGIPGLGHWCFISTILLCYLITPILCKYLKAKTDFLKFMITLCIIEMFLHFIPYFNAAWINCYCIGFYYGKIKNEIQDDNGFIVRVAFKTIILNVTKIALKYVLAIQPYGIFSFLIIRFYCYTHVLLGFSLFLILKNVLSMIQPCSFVNYIAKSTDRFSYDIYLVHQIFILGPCSVLSKPFSWEGSVCSFSFNGIWNRFVVYG